MVSQIFLRDMHWGYKYILKKNETRFNESIYGSRAWFSIIFPLEVKLIILMQLDSFCIEWSYAYMSYVYLYGQILNVWFAETHSFFRDSTGTIIFKWAG